MAYLRAIAGSASADESFVVPVEIQDEYNALYTSGGACEAAGTGHSI